MVSMHLLTSLTFWTDSELNVAVHFFLREFSVYLEACLMDMAISKRLLCGLKYQGFRLVYEYCFRSAFLFSFLFSNEFLRV